MSTGAFLNTLKVFEMTCWGMAYIDAIREDEDEECIKQAMRPRWFRRARTRAEAVAACKAADPYFFPSQRGWGELQVLERIAALCLSKCDERDDDLIFVSAEDFQIIKRNALKWSDYNAAKPDA